MASIASITNSVVLTAGMSKEDVVQVVMQCC